MTIQGNTICNLIQTFPVLLILAQKHNRCLETHFIYKPPSPTQSPEYYQALDALFQNLYGHGYPHGHGNSDHGHEYPGHQAGYDYHQPCYTYSKKYGTKPCYVYPGHSYSYGTSYGNHGVSYGNHGSGYGNYGSGYGNHGSGYGNYGSGYGNRGTYAAYVPKIGNIYGENVTYGAGYASSQGYTVNNKYKVVVKKTKMRNRKRKSEKLRVEANTCKTVNGGTGSCIRLHSCKAFMEVVQTSYSSPITTWMLRQSHCGFDGSMPKVCCPQDELKDNHIESTTPESGKILFLAQTSATQSAITRPTTISPIFTPPSPITTTLSTNTSPPKPTASSSKLTFLQTKPISLLSKPISLLSKPTTPPKRRLSTAGPVWGTLTTRMDRDASSGPNSLVSINSVGETCITVYNTTGGCKDIYFCDPFLEVARTAGKNPDAAKMLQRAQCGFIGTRPKVCCPLPELPNASPSVRTTAPPSIQPVSVRVSLPSAGLRASLQALPEPPVCGFSNVSLNRVVGGVPAKLGAFPWMALIGYNDLLQESSVSWKCGGSLVSTRHVLTAAHCIHRMEDSIYLVRLGELDLAREDEGASPLDVLISTAIKHELYTPNKPVVNDIGILVLEKDVAITNLIRPICLPISNQYRSMTFESYTPFVAGWGNLKAGNSIAATHLQVAQVPVSEQGFCEASYPELKARLFERALCAGYTQGGTDSCKGDSGGPLIQPLPSSSGGTAYYVIGVVSGGRRCAEGGGSPGLYARVSYYMPWIEEKMLGRAS